MGHGVTADNIILGNGSIELIYMIAEMFPCNFKAVIPVPSFTEYEKAVLRVGGEPVFVQLPENFALENEKIKKAVTDDTKIYLSATRTALQERCTAKKRFWILLNSAKRKTSSSASTRTTSNSQKRQEATMAGYVKKYENLFVIRSVTKFYGMPGIRFGYGIAAESLIDTACKLFGSRGASTV